jgi:hypothetical protein
VLLNIDSKGNITWNGQAFPLPLPSGKYASKPVGVTATQIPYQFTFDTGAGIQVYAAGSYVLNFGEGKLRVMSAAEFAAAFAQA